VAKEGYVNLLPVQQKNSLEPGDAQTMLQARRAFLDAGHYAPLAERLRQHLADVLHEFGHQSSERPLRCLDIGSGEGYYVHQLQQGLRTSAEAELAFYGFDIAKYGVKKAAKRYPQAHWAVASAYQLPYVDQHFAVATRIYAPSEPAEVYRCLKAKGYWLTVTPAPNHLLELKQRLYLTATPHSDARIDYPGFLHQQRDRLGFALNLQQQDLDNLIQMTPLAWRGQHQDKSAALAELIGEGRVQVDFYIDIYQRQPD